MTLSLLPTNAFPLPVLPTPKLAVLGLDNKTVTTVSKVYLSSALALKGAFETEYIKACEALLVTSDNRGYSSEELRAKLLTVSVTRYTQALSKWTEEIIRKTQASVRRKSGKPPAQFQATGLVTPPLPNDPKRHPRPQSKRDTGNTKPVPFDSVSPPHAFPHVYPPSVPPVPISFVKHISLLERSSRREPRAVSDDDLDACIDALSRLSLGQPSPRSGGSRKPSKTDPKPRSRPHTASKPKATFQLSPSRPRLASPTLDTSTAVPHKPLPKHAPLHTSPANSIRTQNIDIPRSNRRKTCSIPYRRPTIHPPTSPESPESVSFSPSIHRTPSLVSDHGSEASSPSTPPDFSSMPVYAPSLDYKNTFPEPTFLFGDSAICYPGEYDIDFGTDIYG